MYGKLHASLDNLKITLELLRDNIKPPTMFDEIVKDYVENSSTTASETFKKLEDELQKVERTEPPAVQNSKAIREERYILSKKLHSCLT